MTESKPQQEIITTVSEVGSELSDGWTNVTIRRIKDGMGKWRIEIKDEHCEGFTMLSPLALAVARRMIELAEVTP